MTDEDVMKDWRQLAQEQRTAAITLFLNYAVGLLGVLSTVLLASSTAALRAPLMFVASGLAALLSAGVGCCLVLIRLREARLRARVPRLQAEQARADKIETARNEIVLLKDRTQSLIELQVASFALAVVCFLLWVAINYGHRLVPSSGQVAMAQVPQTDKNARRSHPTIAHMPSPESEPRAD